jgi:hypothetical protein
MEAIGKRDLQVSLAYKRPGHIFQVIALVPKAHTYSKSPSMSPTTNLTLIRAKITKLAEKYTGKRYGLM